MKWLKSYKIFESSHFLSEDIKDILEILQYFLDEESIDITRRKKEGIGESDMPKSLVIDENEYDFFYRFGKLYIIICLNKKTQPSVSTLNKIIELKNKLVEKMIPIMNSRGYKTEITITEQKVNSWNFVETGIKIEVENE